MNLTNWLFAALYLLPLAVVLAWYLRRKIQKQGYAVARYVLVLDYSL